MTTPSDTESPSGSVLSLVGLAVTALLAGGFIGATTNAVSALVSPTYFVTILGWSKVENVWRASIAQGIFEGLILGIFLSIVFTATVGIVSGTRCSFGMGLRYLAGMTGAVYACWVLGGILAMALAMLSPDFYRHAFIGVPEEFWPMLAYAWVGGSIWGAEFGGIASVVIGLVIFRGRWRTLHAIN